MRKFTDFPISVDAGFCVFTAFMFLVVPLPWMAAWFTAALFHELCHYAALKAFDVPVMQLRITSGGAIMETDIRGIKACVSSLAGPLGGLFLTLFGRQMPRLAVCALVQSIYNLLPVYPLDGGRAIREMLETFAGPTKAKRISNGLGGAFLTALMILALYMWIRLTMGCIPLFLVLFLAFKTSFIKFPCKGSHFGLQYNVNKKRMR